MANNLPVILRRLYRRSIGYKSLFLGKDGKPDGTASIVLADLHWFCHAERTTARALPGRGIDPLAMAIAEGRREVWNRIQHYIRLDETAIVQVTALARMDERVEDAS